MRSSREPTPPAASQSRRRPRITGSCTEAVSKTRMATSGRTCGWTQRSPAGKCPSSMFRPDHLAQGEKTMATQPAPVVTAFDWVPDFAKGLVRDLRVRWAFEELGEPYGIEKFGTASPRPDDYVRWQPFEQ